MTPARAEYNGTPRAVRARRARAALGVISERLWVPSQYGFKTRRASADRLMLLIMLTLIEFSE